MAGPISWRDGVAEAGRLGRSPGLTLIRALLVALALLLTSQYVISPVRAYGISMQPTFEPGAWLWLSRLAYLRRPPARGDIVAVNLAGGQAVLVKRIVGLPGERIAITEGQVLVNGVPFDEPYVTERQPWNVRRRATWSTRVLRDRRQSWDAQLTSTTSAAPRASELLGASSTR